MTPQRDVRIGLNRRGSSLAAAAVDRDGTVLAGRRVPIGRAVDGGVGAALDGMLTTIPPERVGRVVMPLPAPEPAEWQRVAVLRIGAPAATAIPPLTGWPAHLAALAGPIAMVRGGHDHDGDELSPLDVAAVTAFGRRCRGTVGAVAVVGVHAHENPEHEVRAADLLLDVLGESVPVLRSAEQGGTGLLERENTTVLDAAAVPVAKQRADALVAAVGARLPAADLYFLRGDGTVLPTSAAYRRTTASRGGGLAATVLGGPLSVGRTTAVVVEMSADAGGTVRVGTVVDEVLPPSGRPVEVDGVRTVHGAPRITELSWDGSAATTGRVRAAVARARPAGAPVVVVGERSDDVRALDESRELLRPADPDLAGAVGAAAAQASGTVDRIFWMSARSREDCLAEARRSARDAAVRTGADPRQLRVLPARESLMTYVPLPCVRLQVTAVGPLLDPR